MYTRLLNLIAFFSIFSPSDEIIFVCCLLFVVCICVAKRLNNDATESRR